MATMQADVADLTPPAPGAFEQKAEVIGDYEILGKLGQGGMGAVYRARQISLDREVALKILPSNLEEDENFVARFQREAAVAAGLNHPNLVQVYASGCSEGCHFIAMELVEGENLRQRVKRGRLPMAEALQICLEVARGLHFAWQRAQLIHRDIKPSNIYLAEGGTVKVGDLGLAKSLLSNTTGLTHTGTAIGTPHYISPEQARGDKTIDLRADIYSLGCTLYELLTGATPYKGTDPLTVMSMHLNSPPPAIMKVLPQCPMPVGRLVNKMLRKSRQERPQTYEELIAAMEAAQQQLELGTTAAGVSPVLAAWREIGGAENRGRVARSPTPVPSGEPSSSSSRPPLARRSKPGLWIGLAAAVLVVGAGAFILMKPTPPHHAAVLEATNAGAPLKTEPAQPASRQTGFAAVAPGAPLATLSYPQPPKWTDATAAFRSENLANGLLIAEGDWLKLKAEGNNVISLPGNLSLRNPILRVIFSERVSLSLRRVRQDGKDTRYSGHLSPEKASILLTHAATSRLTDRGLDLPDRLAGEHEAVFAAQGDALTLWLDGKAVATAHDSTLPAGWIAVQLTKGDALGDGRIKKVEYGELPDPAPATARPSPSTEPWQDVLRDPAKLLLFRGAERTPEGLRFTDHGWVLLDPSQGPRRSGAVRMLATFGDPRPELRARSSENIGFYRLFIKDEKTIAFGLTQGIGNPWKNLGEFPLREPLQSGHDYELELRVVGQTLTAKLGGDLVGSITDATIPEGQFGVAMTKWNAATALVKALEVLDLDAPTGASATPATATKDAPFINSLAMKFVPVPITGGPTDGQRVLFCVWETRVKDYWNFASETKREWPKSGFEQGPTHPAVNVTWDDAQAFCAWLTEREREAGRLGENEQYRLPTDHEWSCAVGLGEREDAAKTPHEKDQKIANVFPWGSAWPPPPQAGNYAGEELQPALAAGKYPWTKSVLPGYRDGYVETAPAGSFPANRFGLYDLGGNAREWCEDWYDSLQDCRVLRGASWDYEGRGNLLSSKRNHIPPATRNVGYGFRTVVGVSAR